jgi:hypothetical protein
VYDHLPLLLLRFFGFAAGVGWLETGSELAHAHREALMRIVKPDGPVVAFCAAHSPPVGAQPRPEEMRFEFPVSNLPAMTVEEIYEYADDAANTANGSMISALAPLVVPCLMRETNEGQPAVLLLSPMDYFFLCMVASPAQKVTIPPNSYAPGTRRPKPRRSASLPSTRAMFNHVLSDHLLAMGRVGYLTGGKTLLIPACMDYYLVPLTTVAGFPDMPEASTPTVDSLTCALLVLRPLVPEDLLLSSGRAAGLVDVSRDSPTAALYATTQDVLRTVFRYFPVGPYTSLGTLAAYMRLLALYLAPWNASTVDAVKASLYAKPRPAAGSTVGGVSSPSMAAITSTLTSLNSQLPRQLQSSPKNQSDAGSPKEESWKTAGMQSSRTETNSELVRLAVVKCANCRLGASSEGHRALALLADAARASGIERQGGDPITNLEEVRGSLHALSDQCLEAEARSGRKSKAFVSALSKCLGVKFERPGMLSGMAGMVGVGSAAAGVVSMMAQAAGGSASTGKRRLRDRRKNELPGVDKDNVPFLGGVWDRPMQGNESETAVVLAYRLALWMEPRLGFLPNLRFLGRVWFVRLSICMLVGAALVLRIGAQQ